MDDVGLFGSEIGSACVDLAGQEPIESYHLLLPLECWN